MIDYRFIIRKQLRKLRRSPEPCVLQPEPAVLKEFSTLQGRVFVDLGANIGYYSRLLSKQFETIYAVEADYDTFLRLRKKIDRYPHIHPVRAKIGDKDDWGNTTTYNTLFSHREAELVKMDIEGDEFKALEGMRESFAKKKIQRIMIELHDKTREEELKNFLVERGFEVRRIDDHPRFMATLDS